jgi:hypothetical protein
MAKTLSDETIRRRDVRVKLEWSDIKRMITEAAMKEAGIEGDPAHVEIEIKQEERGSPSYRVSEWSAVAKVTMPVDATGGRCPVCPGL